MKKIVFFIFISLSILYVYAENNNENDWINKIMNYFCANFISIISFCLSFYAVWITFLNKKIEINAIYIKELQIKRLKYYPRLHEKTDNLGNLIRNNCPIKDQTQLKNQLEVQLMEISNWDAHYAIYAGPQVTSELFNIRRALEKLIKTENFSQEDLFNLYRHLINLEYSLKCELGVLLEDSLEIESKAEFSKRQYLEKIETVNNIEP